MNNCKHSEVIKYLDFDSKFDLVRCCVGGHDPACIKCPDCGKWIRILLKVEGEE